MDSVPSVDRVGYMENCMQHWRQFGLANPALVNDQIVYDLELQSLTHQLPSLEVVVHIGQRVHIASCAQQQSKSCYQRNQCLFRVPLEAGFEHV